MYGNFRAPNVIGVQGIRNSKRTEKGAGLVGTEAQPIVSVDPKVYLNFRPSDVEIGPDGAIYFTDWQNAIIGHMQHHLRDPNRDHAHGRVYRVTYTGRPLDKAAPIAGQSVAQLLDLLKSPENRVRYRAKIELSAHDAKEVALDSLNKDQDEYLKYSLEKTTKTLENIDKPQKPAAKAAKKK